MLVKQLVTSVAENAINRFLATQPAVQPQFKALQGKRLSVFLDILNKGITFVFYDNVLLINGPDSFEQAKAELDGNTCVIKTKMSVIGKLSDASQLTSLIQNKELDIAGELSISQKVSEIVSSGKFDLEEAIAHYTSDVFAHGVSGLFSAVNKKAQYYFTALSGQASDIALEERPVAARRQAVEAIGMQIEKLRDDVERTSLKLERYEQHVRVAQCD